MRQKRQAYPKASHGHSSRTLGSRRTHHGGRGRLHRGPPATLHGRQGRQADDTHDVPHHRAQAVRAEHQPQGSTGHHTTSGSRHGRHHCLSQYVCKRGEGATVLPHAHSLGAEPCMWLLPGMGTPSTASRHNTSFCAFSHLMRHSRCKASSTRAAAAASRSASSAEARQGLRYKRRVQLTTGGAHVAELQHREGLDASVKQGQGSPTRHPPAKARC
jgi:hypothetical protein